MRRIGVFLSSVVTAVAASLCCILPLVAGVTGVGTLAAAGEWERLRPYLLAVTALLLLAGLLLAYRDSKRACAPGEACTAKGSSRWSVWSVACVTALVIAVAAFPYYSGAPVQAMSDEGAKKMDTGPVVTKIIFVSGMTCAACASGLEASFRNLPGVRKARVEYNAKRATITYDPAGLTEQVIRKLITDTGYQMNE